MSVWRIELACPSLALAQSSHAWTPPFPASTFGDGQDGALQQLTSKAEACIWATGDRVIFSMSAPMVTESGDETSTNQQDYIEDRFKLCSQSPADCLKVVQKAVQLPEAIEKALLRRYGPSKQKFQQAILNSITQDPQKLWGSFWKDSAYELDVKDQADWENQVIVRAESECLHQMTDDTKHNLLCEDFESKGAHMKADEKEDEIDQGLLEKIKSKLKKKHAAGMGEDEGDTESKAWRELPTSKAYLKALRVHDSSSSGTPQSFERFEDAPEEAKRAVIDRWDGLRQGEKGFNDKADELMKEDGVPYHSTITAPMPGEPIVQPYQETVSWLVHPLSIPNPRLLVAHRTGAGKTCSMIRIFDNFFKDKRPKIAIFPVRRARTIMYFSCHSITVAEPWIAMPCPSLCADHSCVQQLLHGAARLEVS